MLCVRKEGLAPKGKRAWHPKLVIPAGFEPATYCLEGNCSIQLSYGTVDFKVKINLTKVA